MYELKNIAAQLTSGLLANGTYQLTKDVKRDAEFAVAVYGEIYLLLKDSLGKEPLKISDEFLKKI